MKSFILTFIISLSFLGTAQASEDVLSHAFSQATLLQNQILKKGKLEYWSEAYKQKLKVIYKTGRKIFKNQGEGDFALAVERAMVTLMSSPQGSLLVKDPRLYTQVEQDLSVSLRRASSYTYDFPGLSHYKKFVKNHFVQEVASKELVAQTYVLPKGFKEKIRSLDLEQLKLLKNVLESRLFYIENRDELKDHFVKGSSPSLDRSQLKSVLFDLNQANTQVKSFLNANKLTEESCHQYFERNDQAYEELLKFSEVIIKSKALGLVTGIGQFWQSHKKEKKRTQYSEPSLEEARSLLAFELLFNALSLQESLFLQKRELSPGLFGNLNRACEFTNRSEVESLVKKRMERLLALKLLIIGQRGAWDVGNMANLFVGDARSEVSKMQKSMAIWGGVTLVVSAFVPFVSPLAIQYIPYASQMYKVVRWGVVGYSLYLGSGVGYEAFQSEKAMSQMKLRASLYDDLDKQLSLAMELPESALDLYKVAQDYETHMHKEILKMSPSQNASLWAKAAIKRFGSLEAASQAYKKQLKFIDESIRMIEI